MTCSEQYSICSYSLQAQPPELFFGRADRPREHPNVVDHNSWEKGDVNQGFAEADYVMTNTPGGRVDSAINIRDALLKTGIKTITFVNPMAVSAGSLHPTAATSVSARYPRTIASSSLTGRQPRLAPVEAMRTYD